MTLSSNTLLNPYPSDFKDTLFITIIFIAANSPWYLHLSIMGFVILFRINVGHEHEHERDHDFNGYYANCLLPSDDVQLLKPQIISTEGERKLLNIWKLER